MNILSTISTEELSQLNIYNRTNINDNDIENQIIEIRKRKCFNNFYDKLSKQTFRNDDKLGDNQSMNSIKLYSDNFDKMNAMHKGLLIYGGVGVGKSYAAACVGNAVIEKGYTCCMTDFSRIINSVWSLTSNKQEYIDSLNQYHLLIIDDLAAERDTEYSNEVILSVINSRCKTGKPLIVTTNIVPNPKECPDIRKQRIYSRLYEMCIPINLKGTDRRERILSEDYMKLKELLQLSL